MWSAKVTWLCVIGAFAGWAAVVTFVMLQLHSGYSGSFLGIWTPPNTHEFRRAMGIGFLSALLTSTGIAVLAGACGSGVGRWVALVPAGLGVLALLTLLFNAVVDAFA